MRGRSEGGTDGRGPSTTRGESQATRAGDAESSTPRVLVVDDDPGWRDLTSTRLGTQYDVHTASSGTEALSMHESVAFDVVLLDRQMPGLSGGETLAALRDAGYDGPVALVTNVEPNVEIADWPFDDYAMKSSHVGDLAVVVDRLLNRAAFGELVRERFALASKKAALESQHDTPALDASPEYNRLVERLEDLRRGITPRIADLSADQAFAELLPAEDSTR